MPNCIVLIVYVLVGHARSVLPPDWGESSIKLWCREGHLERVQEYIGKGGDFEHRFPNENNCLHEACVGGHLKLVKYLIEARGANIEARDKHGQTPLHRAVVHERPKVLKYLLERGADVNSLIQDNSSFTAMGEAVIMGRLGLATILLENGADVVHKAVSYLPPLHAASFAAQPKLVELLLRFGADPEVVLRNGSTPLSVAGTSPRRNTRKGAKEGVVKLLNDTIETKRSGEMKWFITGLVVALLTIMGLKIYYNHQRAARYSDHRKIVQEQWRVNEV
jgi:ankyrin repeat protein